MQIDLQTNVVYEHLAESDKRIVIEQGGTRSGKTYNILLWIIFGYCLQNTGKTISIVRKSFPSLRGSAMRDFYDIIKKYGLYSETWHQKTTSEYYLNTNRIEFVSLDQPQKIRGRKRDICFINEGNELHFEDFFQLNIRTTERLIIDYNPSDEFHWIYDKLIPRDDCDFYKTTYLDNPFLGDELVSEIERLKDIDEVYWKIYGLGERAQARSVIFRFDTLVQIPEDAKLISYGLDFGYTNDPTALVEVYQWGEDSLIFNELVYETGLTNRNIAEKMRSYDIDHFTPIWGDSAEPKSIDEIHKWGFNIKPTTKGKDSVMVGIDLLRRYNLFWTDKSTNGIKEMRNYKWIEDKDGKMLNRPIDAFNHLIDALRYGAYMALRNPNQGEYHIL